jgi:hypothetical protein
VFISQSEFDGDLLHRLLAYPLPKGRGVRSQGFLIIRYRLAAFAGDAIEQANDVTRVMSVSRFWRVWFYGVR